MDQIGKVVAADFKPKATSSGNLPLDRRTASQTASIAAVKRGTKNPSLALMLPEASVVPFVTQVLATPEAFVGIWLIEVFPMITARFTQPLQKMPAGDLSFGVRLQRRTSALALPWSTCN
jgi:hypothetical protein